MTKIALIAAVGVLLSACAATPLQPTAAKVLVSPNPAPKGCKYLGQIVGGQGGAFTGGFTSNRDLEAGAMNDMRNQASQLGANYVQMITNRAADTGSYRKGTGSTEQTSVTSTGNAYNCPPEAIGV